MLRAIGLSRADCYVASLAVTRPPGGRCDARDAAELDRLLWHHLRLVPELAVLDQPLADGDAACIVVQDGAVQWTGPESSVPAAYARLPRHDGRGALVTPGLVDCHTHLVYGGQRANEFELRLEGASYAEIAQAGGGILSTVSATRAADEAQLLDAAERRLRNWLGEGVGTRQIAEKLRLATSTVESYRAGIKQKLGLARATELVARAAQFVVDEPRR